MIAVHSALYIFKPKTGGEGGLYPYRRWAYGIYVFLPLLLSGLAFINNSDSYVTDGTYCYLPVRPFWYRLALSWIPRYLIFIIILGIYASIYFYVRYKFQGFSGEGHHMQNDETLDSTQIETLRRASRPITPPLMSHGLIPVSRQASANEVEASKRSASIPEAQRKPSMTRRPSVHQFMFLASFTTKVQPQIPTPPSELSVDSDSFIGPVAHYADIPASPPSVHSMSSQPQETSWRDPFVHPFSPQQFESQNTQLSMPENLPVTRVRHGDTDTSSPISQLQLQLTTSRGENLTDLEMLRTRDKIRRQLRFLFIYPLVYIGMWIVPFVSHVMQYDDRYAVNPPFGLTCFTTICICSMYFSI